ncbi:hypothetical protein [Arsukibacterium ikkense]|nr:hypothetical protein [Arsukibacterium ikkense]
MRKTLFWFTLVLGLLLVSPLHAEPLTGKWRGKLQISPQDALILYQAIIGTDIAANIAVTG